MFNRIMQFGCCAAIVAAAASAPGAEAPAFAPAGPPPGARVTDRGWFAPIVRTNTPPALPAEGPRAFVIPIHTEIAETAYKAIRRKVGYCRSEGAELVIFDMDTPGGRVDWMKRIAETILNDLADVYTVAYVNPEAISAGAIIAMACDEVIMSPTGSIGDAMPVRSGPQGYVAIPEKERGKIESYLRAYVRLIAKRHGYNVAMSEAMVTSTIELWVIRNRRTRELSLVDAAEWRGKVAGAPGQARPGDATGEWDYLRTFDGPDKPLTLDPPQAVFAGLSKHILGSLGELAEHYGVAEPPAVLEDTWSEELAGFLTSMTVTSVLLMAGIFLIYTEINTPGFGVAGGLAIVCFAIVFGSRYLIGLANWWEIALFVVGLVLIAVEVFVTPGFGVLGIGGILCCIVSLLAMAIPNAPDKLPIPQVEMDWDLLASGAMALCLGFIGGLIACALVAKYLPKIPIAGRIVLAAAESTDEAPVGPSSPMRHIAVGDVGAVEAVCRPVGKVRFGDDLFDAMAEGGAIEAGAKVRVLRKEGNRLVVEETG